MGRMDARRDSGIELSPNDGANQAAQEPSGTSNESILWIGPDRHVGVKLRVTRRTWKRDTPILFQSDDEVAVSYQIEYEGKFRFTAALQDPWQLHIAPCIDKST